MNIIGRDSNAMKGNRDNLMYYHGVATPAFPNHFSMTGNNSLNAHGEWISAHERVPLT
jgi:hypothetical protein